MNQFAVLLGFLASPGESQVDALPSLPVDVGAKGFFPSFASNPLLVLVQAYGQYFHHKDCESWGAFQERLGVPDATPWPSVVEELSFLLGTLRPLGYALWTQQALLRRPEWRLMRRVAGAFLAECGWSEAAQAEDIAALVERYGRELEAEWREYGRPW